MTASHVRLNIFPDGGVSRLRVFGQPTPEARRTAVVRQLNAMDAPELAAALSDFCGAPEWIDAVAAARPFASAAALTAATESAFARVTADGWHEAFRHHPRIGERNAERGQSGAASELSSREQAGIQTATAADVAALAEGNRAYEARFGHGFIVCASGRTASEMLATLRERMNNDPDTELGAAAAEQQKITRLRWQRVLG